MIHQLRVQIERGRIKTVTENWRYVKSLMECLLYCSQQGIALRGHREADLEDMSVNVGNFRSLLLLQARHDDVVREQMLSGLKNASWLGHDLQNSLISIMAEWVLKTIISEVKTARYYTLIVDETKDVSKVLRYVYEGVVRERFISYTHCEELHASALTSYIFQVLDGLLINITNCMYKSVLRWCFCDEWGL